MFMPYMPSQDPAEMVASEKSTLVASADPRPTWYEEWSDEPEKSAFVKVAPQRPNQPGPAKRVLPEKSALVKSV
jgi:hypothetical protein